MFTGHVAHQTNCLYVLRMIVKLAYYPASYMPPIKPQFNPLSQVVFFHPFPLRRGELYRPPLLNFAN